MEDVAIQNIDYINKAVSKPSPDRVEDIDTKNYIYDNIIDAVEKGTLDISSINSFTSVSKSRDQIYDLLDMMSEDPIISSALEIYASDASETNDQGDVMWVSSDDPVISASVEDILNSFNVNKNAYSQIYSLCKYGDIYLKLYRDSEFNYESIKDKVESTIKKLNESAQMDESKKKLLEDIYLKMYSKNDRYAKYAEMVKNPAEMFDLTKFGKTCAYIKTNIPKTSNANNDSIAPGFNSSRNNIYNYRFNYNDTDIYGATEFVHGCLEEGSDRVNEEVSIIRDDAYDKTDLVKLNNYNDLFDDDYKTKTSSSSANINSSSTSFSVRKGKSILYDSFKIWRELSLLENSVLLNRLTKSSILRTINVEVGDMGKTEVQTLLRRVKSLVEQKTAYNLDTSMQNYVNPGPAENIIYFPTHNGTGAVTASQIGGDVEVGDLNDLNYWKKKLFASLSIPGQYLGDTDDNTGFNGGTSLSIISSRYAKNIKRVQNAYIQMYTDAINLIFLDRGQKDFINKFTLHMQAPSTQEERDRKENMSNAINTVREIMSLLDDIEDRQTKLEILKSLLSSAISNQYVIECIQDEIDKLESTEEDESSDSSSELDFDDDLDGGDFDFDNNDDLGDLPSAEEVETTSTEIEAPEESFYSGTGEVLNERNELPSFEELGVSFTDVH